MYFHLMALYLESISKYVVVHIVVHIVLQQVIESYIDVVTVPFPVIAGVLKKISPFMTIKNYFHFFDATEPFFYKDKIHQKDFSDVTKLAYQFGINSRVITRHGGRDQEMPHQ